MQGGVREVKPNPMLKELGVGLYDDLRRVGFVGCEKGITQGFCLIDYEGGGAGGGVEAALVGDGEEGGGGGGEGVERVGCWKDADFCVTVEGFEAEVLGGWLAEGRGEGGEGRERRKVYFDG